jgi:two-component system, NtrC family, nitrogen regulation sensor histidine kinase GlnL
MALKYRFALDRKLRVNSWDESLERLTGEPASVALGKKYYEVFPRLTFRDRDAAAFAIENLRKVSVKNHNFHCLFYRATADIIIQPVLTSKGARGADITVSDVSFENGYTAEEIRHLIAMGKAASTLAHGVRNPLNAMQGAIVVISNKYAQENILMEFVRIMQDEITRLDDFTTKFLGVSLENMSMANVDINAMLKKIERLISYQAHARKIRSNFCYGRIPPALVNPFQVEQAILNIINNALEAIGSDGGLTVSTALGRYSENEYIEIEISDNGPGIDGDSLPDSGTRKMNGKGYGLRITEELMNNCGGHMQIQSIMGKGTSVRLFIPAKLTGGTDGKQRQGTYPRYR